MGRIIDLNQIVIPEGYEITVFKRDLNTPISLAVTDENDFYIGESGMATGDGKLLRLTSEGYDVVASGFNPPLTGITYHEENFYVAHRGTVTKVSKQGVKKDLIINLPSFGDHHNNRVEFGPDGKMYFGQGTATNSAVVGLDNINWVNNHPYFHDYPGGNITLVGRNYETDFQDERVLTGAYSPYRVPSFPQENVKGIVRASGSVLRANEDGTELERICWGLRNPFVVKFDRNNRLFCTNHGMDIRGSRPIANSPDEFQLIEYGKWYGWPDYTGGFPVTHPYFKPDNKPQPEFLLMNHPMQPPQPFVNFTPHSAITGFDFSNASFGYNGDPFIAEFGAMDPGTTGGIEIPTVGRQISRVDLMTQQIHRFIYNKSTTNSEPHHNGGLSRPVDVLIKGNNMYIVDFGTHQHNDGGMFAKNAGVIFKVTKLK